ncbi:MAG: family N-acetyltransferase [Frankiales bacterium]|nr:family N-acetyltransferase [Frankiales bacterium]
MRLRLRPLGPDDEEAFLEAHALMQGGLFSFGSEYQPGMPWRAYLDLVAQRAVHGAAPGRVPSSFLVADVGGRIVGGSNIRWELNAWLAEIGGHIGYGVLPQHRRRGHATEILHQALAMAGSRGIPNALLTCDEDNVGSRLVIERCGGIFERHAVDPDGPLKRRYWVPTLRA